MACKKRLPPTFDVVLTDIDSDGASVGQYENFTVRVFGALPGEHVRAFPIKVRRREVKAGVEEVREALSCRREPRDGTFLSSSPWQIAPEAMQYRMKRLMSMRLFIEKYGMPPLPDVEVGIAAPLWGYRNKMEFSVTEVDGKLSLALHQRFRFNRHLPLTESAIAAPALNSVASHVVAVLDDAGVKAQQLKSIVVRWSGYTDSCIAAVYTTHEDLPLLRFRHPNLAGWLVAFSDPLSPASKLTRVLAAEGEANLLEAIPRSEGAPLHLEYAHNGFFQVHPPAFGVLLDWVREQLREHGWQGGRLLDLYSGVGTIGLALADQFEQIRGVEFEEDAVMQAVKNAERNGISSATFEAARSEKSELPELLQWANLLVVDPPRSGLHPKVVKRIIDHGPERFVYISCNPKTQAIDLAGLQEAYYPVGWKLFDLYPQTPHCESVLILQRSGG